MLDQDCPKQGGSTSTLTTGDKVFLCGEEPVVTLSPDKLIQHPLPKPIGTGARGMANAAQGSHVLQTC